MRTYFYSYRNGDFHIVRAFIRDLMVKYRSDEYLYYSCLPFIGQADIPHVLSDIGGLQKTKPYRNLGSLPPCYIGVEETLINVHPGALGGVSCDNTTFHLLYRNFKQFFGTLGISIDPEVDYLPWIDFKKCHTQPIDNVLRERGERRRVFVANNLSLSGQSVNFDFDPILIAVATHHPETDFYVSNPGAVRLPNLLYVPEITGPGFNLNEIAYLSTFCPVLIGRLSGPHSFSLIRENLMNLATTFVCFNNAEVVARWFDGRRSKVVWSNRYSQRDVIDVIERCL